MLTRHRGAADQAGFLAGDEQRRDRLQQPLVGRVRLEGGAELRLVEQRPKPARDAACGPNEACPPSLATTCQRPSAGKSAATPSPVPGPSTTLTPARAATGLPSGRVCAGPSRGSAQAMASKSLSTRSCENPKRLAN